MRFPSGFPEPVPCHHYLPCACVNWQVPDRQSLQDGENSDKFGTSSHFGGCRILLGQACWLSASQIRFGDRGVASFVQSTSGSAAQTALTIAA